ncbi:MAG TPA: adenosylcobinamide-GDP ribazoletransferase [Candidatus Binatia bacterium]
MRAFFAEARAAVLFLVGSRATRVPRDVARGSMLFPAIGFVQGVLVAALLLGAARLDLPRVALALLGVALLWLASRGTLLAGLARLVGALGSAKRGGRDAALARLEDGGLGAAGAIVCALVLVAKAGALALLDGGALDRGTLALAVVLAATLGRWALVVQAYGSLPAREQDFEATLVREMKFREFGVASVSAMAATLALSNAMGVVLLIGSGSVAVGLRIVVHRAFGGVTATTVRAGGELCEAVVLLLAAALVALARALGA